MSRKTQDEKIRVPSCQLPVPEYRGLDLGCRLARELRTGSCRENDLAVAKNTERIRLPTASAWSRHSSSSPTGGNIGRGSRVRGAHEVVD